MQHNTLSLAVLLQFLFLGAQGQINFIDESHPAARLEDTTVHGGDPCITPFAQAGICADLTSCPSLHELMTRPLNTRSRSYLRNSELACSSNPFTFCCPESAEALKVASKGTNGGWGEWTAWTSCANPCVSAAQTRRRDCDAPPPSAGGRLCEGSVNQFKMCQTNGCHVQLPGTDICGRKSNPIANRILHGTAAELNSWPWIVAIGLDPDQNGILKYGCGGNLITRRHVLSAAHCGSFQPITVLLGVNELSLYNDQDGATPREIKIKHIKVHEKYEKRSKNNDIMILTLEEELQFSDSIRPICLTDNPRHLAKFDQLENNYLFVAGWGVTTEQGEQSKDLLEGIVSPVRMSECKEKYKGVKFAVIDDDKFCAFGADHQADTCNGDSGGPLTALADASEDSEIIHLRNFLVGITSYGVGCGDPNFPGVYTRVSKYIPWIKKNLGL